MAESKLFRWLKGGVGLLRDFAYPGGEAGPRRPKVGLALSGGFARGIAHIGVLKVLKEHHIPVDCIAGTSVGALIGAAYAAGTSLEEMEKQAALTVFTDFGRWKLSRLGLASNEKLDEFLARFTKCTKFEELRIPLAVEQRNWAREKQNISRAEIYVWRFARRALIRDYLYRWNLKEVYWWMDL